MPFKPGHSGNKAGRPKGSISKEKREIAEIIAQNGGLEERVQKLRELANGIACIRATQDGGTEIYEKAPDAQANIYLIDRVCGKPKQAIDVNAKVEATWEDMFGIKPVDSESQG